MKKLIPFHGSSFGSGDHSIVRGDNAMQVRNVHPEHKDKASRLECLAALKRRCMLELAKRNDDKRGTA